LPQLVTAPIPAPPARRRYPPLVTAALMAAVVAVAIGQGVVDHELSPEATYRWGFSPVGLLGGGWWLVVSSQFLVRDRFMAVSIPVSLAVMLGAYEWRAGTLRAAAVAGVAAVGGPGLVTAGLAMGAKLGLDAAVRALPTVDYGASAMTAGGGGALVAVVRNRWLTACAVVFVLGGLALHRELADWEHLVTFPVGFALGRLLDRPTGVRPGRRVVRPSAAGGWAITVVLVVLSSAIGGAVAAHAFEAPAPSGSAPVAPARVLDLRYPTPSTGGDRRVLIVLPAGYDDAGDRYPAVEILHGRPGAPDDVLNLADLLGAATTVAPFVAVVPDGHGPVVADGDFADSSRQRLGAALSDDLQRWTDTTFRTDGHWGIMGLSAGGFGAAYLASRPGARYGAVCSLGGYFSARSPAFDGEPDAVRAAASPSRHAQTDGPATLLVAARGDAEGVTEAGQYSAALAAAGQRHDLVLVDGDHDWAFFRAETPRCLRWLRERTPLPWPP
jgi:S-formylglutathione hydrolase FrmB